MGGGKSYEEIKRECLRTGTLYQDPDFPANISTLDQDSQYVYEIEWKRPKDIAGDAPVFIHGGKDYYDMDQGILGNCWFVASVGCLCASPQKDLLKRVIPTDQGFARHEYCGAFKFNFWQYGKWIEVIVDDRLPTLWGKLAYGRNIEKPNEYWCPLLEKAFAKLRGNYENIDGGRVFDGLVDLTGGIGEIVQLKNSITTTKLERILTGCLKMNSCMGGATFNVEGASREHLLDNGLYLGHAYTIVNVKKVQSSTYGEVTLVHLRNPWSKGEWKGAWSDGSKEFNTLTSENMRATMKSKNDGEFWMSIDDFRKNFDELDICHLTPDAFTGELARNLDRSQWKIVEYFSEWVLGKSAGGPLTSYRSSKFWTNPQFLMDLSHKQEDVSVVISMFEIPKTYNVDSKISFLFMVFKYLGRDGSTAPPRITSHNYYNYDHVGDSGLFWPYREKAAHLFLEPGKYVVIPCTYVSGQASKFYLRIFSEEHIITEESSPAVEEVEPVRPPVEESSPPESRALREFNKRAPTGGVIDAYELQDILNTITDDLEYTLGTCRSLTMMLDNKMEKGMVNKAEFERLLGDIKNWRNAFRTLDKNKTGVMEKNELTRLFEIFELGPGTDKIVDAIMTRFGGKDKTVTEDDFIQSNAQVMNLYSIYNALKKSNKISATANEFVAAAILT